MTRRAQLSEELHSLLQKNEFEENVYFQPPSSVQMKYPCIRYERGDIFTRHADDMLYMYHDRYTVTVIDPNPDSPIPDILLKHFRLIKIDRRYTADNLNHTVLTLYY